MKPEEAIEILDRMFDNVFAREQREALGMAYEALKKQITREPGIWKDECPVCGSALTDSEVYARRCEWCGQTFR